MRYFTSPEDLELWVLSNESANEAINKIAEVVGVQDLSVKEGCVGIFDNNLQKEHVKDKKTLDKDTKAAAEALYIALSKYGLTEIQTNGEVKMSDKTSKLKKEAQYRQPGPAITYNRETDNNYNETPWRRDRDQMYGFIHRNPDMVSFNDDPNMVYSGEALWRAYVMDKFTRDYKDDDGRVVGGYINDRFQVFHDVAGNQMELANGERTRRPRPHQYSTERRLEEARGTECEDITPLASSNDMVKLASKDVPSMEGDNIFEMFKDVIDMKEAGIDSEAIICKIAEHYSADVIDVASVHKLAVRQATAHQDILYTASTDGLKKKVVAARNPIDSSSPMVAVSGTKVIPVYTQNGQYSVGSSSSQLSLAQPIRVFPVNGVSFNSAPIYANEQIPEMIGTSGKPTMFFTLSDVSDIADQVMPMDQFQNMLEATSETGLIDENEREIQQLVQNFSKMANPLDKVANEVINETGVQNIEGSEELTNVVDEGIDSMQQAASSTVFEIIEV
jgi:hypothetical protein